MKEIKNTCFDEERALYGEKDLKLINVKFDGALDGESALKECENIYAKDVFFNLRYPLWHVKVGVLENCNLTEKCRAALWYDKDITVKNSIMNGIKAFRECNKIKIENTSVNSPEFLWKCSSVSVVNGSITSEYPFFECKNVEISGLSLTGKYSFQYVQNLTVKDSVLNTKDAFWHAKNVTVINCKVIGEYLGWYSENITFINCQIVGTQPLCYVKNLKIENCTMENTDFSFERSTVNATVLGDILSVKNVVSGSVTANTIHTLIMEKNIVDESKTQINAKIINKEN